VRRRNEKPSREVANPHAGFLIFNLVSSRAEVISHQFSAARRPWAGLLGSADVWRLSPLVEDDELVLDRHVGREQVRDGSDVAARRHVAAAVVVELDDQDTGMRATSLKNQFVEFLKVFVVPR
jgi:hypothetical protein